MHSYIQGEPWSPVDLALCGEILPRERTRLARQPGGRDRHPVVALPPSFSLLVWTRLNRAAEIDGTFYGGRSFAAGETDDGRDDDILFRTPEIGDGDWRV